MNKRILVIGIPDRLILAWLLFAVILLSGTRLYAQQSGDKNWQPGQLPNMMILALDGVPYRLVESMHQKGYFKGFYPPSRMVSTFPSMTDVAFTEIFKMPNIEGYQQVYFSHDQNKVVGGLGSEMFRLEAFEKRFDSILHSKSHLLSLYLTSHRNAKNEWQALKKNFWSSQKTPRFYAYIAGTDAIAHRYGQKGLEKYLSYLNKEISLLQLEYMLRTGKSLAIVILSDHGNTLVEGKLVSSKTGLNRNGFELDTSLKHPGSVVSTVAGVVGYWALHAAPKSAGAIAGSLVDLEGVDLVMYQTPADQSSPENVKGVTLINEKGKANIYYDDENDRGQYQVITGDPIGYQTIINKAKSYRKGYVDQAELFSLTATHNYPNAILRIYRCFYGAVNNPATVIASLKPGYEYSNKIIKVASLLGGRWGTHGSLHAADSLGVYMRSDYQTKDVDAFKLGVDLELQHFNESSSTEFATSSIESDHEESF